MTTFLTSDSHSGHAGIVECIDRPFASVAVISDAMVAIWNSVTGKRDVVWHLADFVFGPRGAAERVL